MSSSVFNGHNMKNSQYVMRRYFSSVGKRFTRQEYKEVSAIANPFGTSSCTREFNEFVQCFSASPDNAVQSCASELTAMDACIQTMPTKKRGTLLFHLSRIINSGGAQRKPLSWD